MLIFTVPSKMTLYKIRLWAIKTVWRLLFASVFIPGSRVWLKKKKRYPAVWNFRRFSLNVHLNTSENIKFLFRNPKLFQILHYRLEVYEIIKLPHKVKWQFLDTKYLCSDTVSHLVKYLQKNIIETSSELLIFVRKCQAILFKSLVL